MSLRSVFLVAIQLIAIAFLVLAGPVLPRQPLLSMLMIVGIAVIIWSVMLIRPRYINVAPEVRTGSSLVTRGPYRFVRHPMYTAGLSVCLIWVIANFTWVKFAVWAAVLIDILVKLHYEERLLKKAFPEYEEYQRHTKRLIPFIY